MPPKKYENPYVNRSRNFTRPAPTNTATSTKKKSGSCCARKHHGSGEMRGGVVVGGQFQQRLRHRMVQIFSRITPIHASHIAIPFDKGDRWNAGSEQLIKNAQKIGNTQQSICLKRLHDNRSRKTDKLIWQHQHGGNSSMVPPAAGRQKKKKRRPRSAAQKEAGNITASAHAKKAASLTREGCYNTRLYGDVIKIPSYASYQRASP